MLKRFTIRYFIWTMWKEFLASVGLMDFLLLLGFFKNSIEQLTTDDLFPKFIASAENITENYGPLGKQIRGGISIWKSDKALLLVESPHVQQFPVKLWLSDPCHAPQYKIVRNVSKSFRRFLIFWIIAWKKKTPFWHLMNVKDTKNIIVDANPEHHWQEILWKNIMKMEIITNTGQKVILVKKVT